MPSLPSFRRDPEDLSPRRSWSSWLPLPAWTDRVPSELVLVGVVGVAVVLAVSVAILSGRSFDRGAAIDRVVADSNGRITAEQAGCYVDRVHAEVGDAYLSPTAHPSEDVLGQLTAIRVDCIGVANLAVAPTDAAGSSVTSVPSTESGNLPRRVGDSAALDALYGQCRDGFGQACDDLFAQAPVGSDYESFAVTCGNRTRELTCAAVYVSPGVTNPRPS